MLSHAGLAKPVLVLLFCVGTWMSSCTPSFGAPQPPSSVIQRTLAYLKRDSDQLLHYYKKEEPGVLKQLDGQPYLPLLPCFTLHPEASNNISVLQAHLESVKRLSNNQTTIDDIIKRLEDLKSHKIPKLNISEPPQDSFKRKCFIMTVLVQLSTCVTDTYEAFLKGWEAESRLEVFQ
uniref:interleukin-31 n=1 Tax=Jaculus jaculus TaxID=51337 RepID=UPI001E1B3CE6|nr:interleukin-31 [Jaculus jaculus]